MLISNKKAFATALAVGCSSWSFASAQDCFDVGYDEQHAGLHWLTIDPSIAAGDKDFIDTFATICENGAGAAGADGADGATGAQGATGVAGTDGADGATGAQGTAGAAGAAGATGAQGTAGAAGAAGATGAQGATGAAGTNGADGATGAQGADGVDAHPGAYSTALMAGAMAGINLDLTQEHSLGGSVYVSSYGDLSGAIGYNYSVDENWDVGVTISTDGYLFSGSGHVTYSW